MGIPISIISHAINLNNWYEYHEMLGNSPAILTVDLQPEEVYIFW